MVDDQEATKKHYKDSAKLAVRGGFHARYSNHSWFDWVDQRLNLPPGARVLDVGCGPGWFWMACKHLPYDMELTLFDQSAHMVDQATARLSHLNIAEHKVGDAVALPFEDDCFDVVMAMHMLYHVPEPIIALREMVRVLVPGGRLMVTTNNPRDLPAVATLSREVFGVAIDDMVQDRFGTPVALKLMQQVAGNVTQDTSEDIYQVDDPVSLIDLLLSIPPGDKADEAGQARLAEAVHHYMAAQDGVAAMPRVQDLISGIKPG